MAGPELIPEVPGCTDLVLVRSGVPRAYRCQYQGGQATALVYPARVDATTAASFTSQAEALRNVSHPQVAPVLAAGLADGFPYVVTAPDTGTLAEQLRGGLGSPADLATLGRYLAEGLAAIHSAGLIHGSLTPGAIVLATDGRPMLSGLTLGLGQHTGHASLNSPSQLYLAPETLRDGTTTALSDLYALGAILYAAAAGQPPLAARMGETTGEHILRVLHEPPTRLTGVPTQYADLVGHLVEKDPANRPDNAETIAARFATLQTELTTAVATPVVRPVIASPPAPQPTQAAQPTPSGESAQPTQSAQPSVAQQLATLPRPRPALMQRNRLRSWPPPTPAPAPAAAAAAAAPGTAAMAPAAGPAPAPASALSGAQPRPSTAPAANAVRQPLAPAVAKLNRSQPAGTTAPPASTAATGTAGAAASAPPSSPPPPPAEGASRRRSWLLAAAGVVVVAGVVGTLAVVNRQQEAARPPATGPTTPIQTPAFVVRLNPPVDHSTYVDLSWSGDAGLNYGVVVAQVGKPAKVKLVFKHTTHRVAVVPGVQYCFAIQATDGINQLETEPQPIRDAQCGT